MDLTELIKWRKEFKKVDGTPQMKLVACDFRDTMNLYHLKGAQIFDLLRSQEVGMAMKLLQAAEQCVESDPKMRGDNSEAN